MTARAPQRPRRDAGFTLAEVLVSLFIFGLVSTLLLAVIDMERRADNAVRRDDGGIDGIAAAQTMLRGRIEAMRSVTDMHGAGNTLSAQGNQTEFNFDAPALGMDGPHALQHFRVRREPGGQLMLYHTSTLSGYDMRERTIAGWDVLPLLDRVASIQFAYFGADRLTGRDAWQDSWEGRRELPRLVRLKLQFAAGDPRRWPVLMVRPLSGVHLPCPPDDKQSPDCGSKP